MSHPARWSQPLPNERVRCGLCPHACVLSPGAAGRCRVRRNENGRLVTLAWGQASAIAVDPIEKKPLYHVRPGTEILSIGGVSCNLRCDFCQNWHISQQSVPTRPFPPSEIHRWLDDHPAVCGLAFTYNEPLIAAEYILDTADALAGSGRLLCLVSNGFIQAEALADILPRVDAWNIDLKGFRDDFYRSRCGGSLAAVTETIATLVRAGRHVEITHLMVPGANDAPGEFAALVDFLAGLSADIPLHISRYHPEYRCEAPPTPREAMLAARDLARKKLRYVYLGNVREPGSADTFCPGCGRCLIRRYGQATCFRREDASCQDCGRTLPGIF